MVSAPHLSNETARLEALGSYGILDTGFEQDYDSLCRLAATICQTPVALISFVDRDRQWFKAAVGMDVRQTPRDIAFCAHAIQDNKLFEVPDATQDERFFDNPLVTESPDIRFYAGQPLVTPGGLALGTLCTIDRVPRVLTEAQREALEILARQVVTTLELRRTLADLRKTNDDKDRFFSIIAHDLRSPFSGLLGLVDLMNNDGPSLSRSEVDRYIGMVHKSLHQVYDLSENLLRWALLEQGKMGFLPETIPVAILFDEVAAPLAEFAAGKSITVTLEGPEGCEVRGDRNMLEGALRNLLSNAVKFTPPGGRIILGANCSPSEVRLSVRDSGLGMDPGQLARITSELRVESSPGTNGERGTGLGLTLVRQFAQRHRGRLEIESEKGKGTLVTLVLPG